MTPHVSLYAGVTNSSNDSEKSVVMNLFVNADPKLFG